VRPTSLAKWVSALFKVAVYAWLWLIGGIFALVILNGGDPPVWLDKAMFEIGVSKHRVEERPIDCDFFTSPMGSKPCHYRREVSGGRIWRRRIEG
jgi:hypothetical protein